MPAITFGWASGTRRAKCQGLNGAACALSPSDLPWKAGRVKQYLRVYQGELSFGRAREKGCVAMISLKTFVKETLSEIVEANREFLAEHGQLGASTSPVITGTVMRDDWKAQGMIFTGFEKRDGKDVAGYVTVIDFDVAVTAGESDATGTKAGLSIKVLQAFNAGVGGDTKTEVTSSSVSRVRFKLPLQIFRNESGE